MDSEVTKYCTKCKQTKLLSEFLNNRTRKDLHSFYCGDCERAITRSYYHARQERLRKAKYAEKNKARAAVKRAVARGAIVKEPCYMCGDVKVYAHHLIYDFPLKVIWLCSLHHAQVHHIY